MQDLSYCCMAPIALQDHFPFCEECGQACDVPKRRTISQNSALHLWCSRQATAFNDAGLDAKTVLKPGAEIPWTGSMVKDLIFRPVIIAMFNKTSTKDLTRKELSLAWEVINRHLQDKFGEGVPFPSLNEIMLKSLTDET